MRGWLAVALLAPVLALTAALYVVPLGVYLVNGFYRFKDGRILREWTLDTYAAFLTDAFSYKIVSTSLLLAAVVTALALLVGYPLAYALHTRVRSARARAVLAVVLFCPLMISVVVRTYGWLILLANQGLVNTTLLRLGLIEQPVRLLFNMQGVVISLTHILLPFAIFPIYSVLGKLDPSLKEAARDLGAGPWATFWKVTLPLTLPGVASGGVICFTLALSAFVTPQLLGGGRVQVLPLTVYNSTVEINWPEGAVTSVALLALSILAVWAVNRALAGRGRSRSPAIRAARETRSSGRRSRSASGSSCCPSPSWSSTRSRAWRTASFPRPACPSAGTFISSISRRSGTRSCGASVSGWPRPRWRSRSACRPPSCSCAAAFRAGTRCRRFSCPRSSCRRSCWAWGGSSSSRASGSRVGCCH
jgi:putative spermidine/putrescine transport system permease protein